MNALCGEPHQLDEAMVNKHPFPATVPCEYLTMATQTPVLDTFTLSGDYEARVAQLLRIARHQARVAQAAAAPHMHDALADLEDTLSDQIAVLENARQDDRADVEYSGEAERERLAWRPLRVA
jgi:hypothetical protein